MNSMKDLLSEGDNAEKPTVAAMAATMYQFDSNYDDALRILHSSADDVETQAMKVQCCLHLDRVDVARKELKKMIDLDDDATLTQLSQAWVNLAMGGEKYQDSFYIFQELADKYEPTVKLLNAQAACHIQQGNYEDAEGLLQEAQAKKSDDPETAINLIALYQYQGKIDSAKRNIAQFKDDFPHHPFVKSLEVKENDFERHSLQYQ